MINDEDLYTDEYEEELSYYEHALSLTREGLYKDSRDLIVRAPASEDRDYTTEALHLMGLGYYEDAKEILSMGDHTDRSLKTLLNCYAGLLKQYCKEDNRKALEKTFREVSGIFPEEIYQSKFIPYFAKTGTIDRFVQQLLVHQRTLKTSDRRFETFFFLADASFFLNKEEAKRLGSQVELIFAGKEIVEKSLSLISEQKYEEAKIAIKELDDYPPFRQWQLALLGVVAYYQRNDSEAKSYFNKVLKTTNAFKFADPYSLKLMAEMMEPMLTEVYGQRISAVGRILGTKKTFDTIEEVANLMQKRQYPKAFAAISKMINPKNIYANTVAFNVYKFIYRALFNHNSVAYFFKTLNSKANKDQLPYDSFFTRWACLQCLVDQTMKLNEKENISQIVHDLKALTNMTSYYGEEHHELRAHLFYRIGTILITPSKAKEVFGINVLLFAQVQLGDPYLHEQVALLLNLSNEIRPSMFTLLMILKIHKEKGRFEDACKVFTQMLKFPKEERRLLGPILNTFLEDKTYVEESMKLLDMSLEAHPDDAVLSFLKYNIYLDKAKQEMLEKDEPNLEMYRAYNQKALELVRWDVDGLRLNANFFLLHWWDTECGEEHEKEAQKVFDLLFEKNINLTELIYHMKLFVVIYGPLAWRVFEALPKEPSVPQPLSEDSLIAIVSNVFALISKESFTEENLKRLLEVFSELVSSQQFNSKVLGSMLHALREIQDLSIAKEVANLLKPFEDMIYKEAKLSYDYFYVRGGAESSNKSKEVLKQELADLRRIEQLAITDGDLALLVEVRNLINR